VSDLKSRVAAKAAPDAQNGNGQQPATIAQFISSMTGEIARALPKHMSADRLARIALTEVRRTPLLAKCTQQSFGGALMTCAQLGLEPGVTGEAYLLPFKHTDKRTKAVTYEVQLVIGYQGMAKLYWQSPLAKTLDAQTVHEGDDFDYEYGLEPKLKHRPAMSGRGAAIAYYAVATLTSGGSAFVVLSRDDVEKIRKRSRAKDSGPWQTDYDAMAKKTAVRQLFKLLPRSPELARAMAQDEAVRTDTTADGIDLDPAFIPGEVVEEDSAGQVDPDAEAAEQLAAQDAAENPLHYGPDEIAEGS
jgi:recombination protein RecT